jgi:hypothetical protein
VLAHAENIGPRDSQSAQLDHQATESTRSPMPSWESGFYCITLAAKVPVAVTFIDYAKHEASILADITLTGDPVTDITTSATHYEGRQGKRPGFASQVRGCTEHYSSTSITSSPAKLTT